MSPRALIVGLLLTVGCKDGPTPAAPKAPPPSDDAAASVRCEWRCGCAKLGSCDAREDRVEMCVDVATTPGGRVPSCDRCRELANADCAKKKCPPAPEVAKNPIVYCDGRTQDTASLPKHMIEPSNTATVAIAADKKLMQTLLQDDEKQQRAQEGGKQVTCRYKCGCTVEQGMCDSHEEHLLSCLDKTDSTKTAPDCIRCRFRALVDCNDHPCPLTAEGKKVAINFTCPVQ